MNKEQIVEKILPILKQSGIKKAALFGSAARGEMNKKSDVDILIEMDMTKSLLDFVGLKLDLEKALGRKVDLLEFRAIKPLLKERIFEDQISVL